MANMRSKFAKPQTLNASDVSQIRRIFQALGWPLTTTYDDPTISRFDRFCEFAADLHRGEFETFLTLTEDFLWVQDLAYRNYIHDAFARIPDSLVDGRKSLYLVPIVDPKYRGVAKSSTSMLYSVAHKSLRHFPRLHAIFEKAITDPIYLQESKDIRTDSLIIFVDDFVGTGTTVGAALNEYAANWRNESDLSIVVSVVAQEIGRKYVEGLGYNFFSGIERRRGITDSPFFADKSEVIRSIKEIERRMKVSKNYSLGFERSEALVSMIRTPNNTLPVFWWNSRPNGTKADGLFPR